MYKLLVESLFALTWIFWNVNENPFSRICKSSAVHGALIKCTCGTRNDTAISRSVAPAETRPRCIQSKPRGPPPKLPSHLFSRVSDLEGACGQPNNEAEAPGDRRDRSVLRAFPCHQCFGCAMLAASRGRWWEVRVRGPLLSPGKPREKASSRETCPVVSVETGFSSIFHS